MHIGLTVGCLSFGRAIKEQSLPWVYVAAYILHILHLLIIFFDIILICDGKASHNKLLTSHLFDIKHVINI